MSAPRRDGATPESAARARLERDVPAVASRRAYLRAGLPGVYREGDFAMRFVGGLEPLLDPIVATLDALPAHFSAALAPPHILELIAAWLGVGLDESQSEEQRREVVRNAAALSRRRGTKAGLELALRLTFADAELRVEDRGGVAVATDPARTEPTDTGFVVYCDRVLPDERMRAIAALVDHFKPVDATYRLKVKRPSGQTGESS